MTIFASMKLTLKIKLLPNKEQEDTILNTLKESNAACDFISDVAFENKIFNQFKLHHLCYHRIKGSFNLSSQMVIRAISKVADSYKLDRKTKRSFNPLGSITYDGRILSYKENHVSLSTVSGRIKVPFVCHNTAYLPYAKGEADLVYKKGKFYLFQTVEVPEEDIDDVEEFIGVDFGITDIAFTSEGESVSSKSLFEYRKQREKIRGSIQSKGTKSCKKLLKRLSGKERTHATIINHTISKRIVNRAKESGKGISVEDLRGIRLSVNKRGKKFRAKVNKWNFGQLRSFIEYKCKRSGVVFVAVKPAYTSQTCSCCHHMGQRNGKSFKCKNCGTDMDADFNAAINIATLGAAVNQPEKSSMYCFLHSA